MEPRVRSPLQELEVQPLGDARSPTKLAEGPDDALDVPEMDEAAKAAALVASVFTDDSILKNLLPQCSIETLISLTNCTADLRKAAHTHLKFRRTEVREDLLLWAARHGCAFALDFLCKVHTPGRLLCQYDPLEMLKAAAGSGSPATTIIALHKSERFFDTHEDDMQKITECLTLFAAKSGSKPACRLLVAELGFSSGAALAMAGLEPLPHNRYLNGVDSGRFKGDIKSFNRYLKCIDACDREDLFSGRYCESGVPLLLQAAIGRRSALVGALLRNGCPHDVVDSAHWTALHWACYIGAPVMTSALLSAGADTEAQIPGTCKTPLHLAAAEDSLECLEALLGAAADARAVCRAAAAAKPGLMGSVNEQAQANAFGFAELPWYSNLRPIELASAAGDDEAVRRLGAAMLIDGRGPIFPNGRRDALKYTVMVSGDLDVLDALLGFCGADVDASDVDGAGPLHWAMRASQEEVVKALLAAGADYSRCDAEGRTPADLLEAAFEGEEERERVRALFVKFGKEG